ncbi:adenine deaminase [Halodurantibacterium flavum]|uniref:Adenine deaminase n=1 Tax=Halodurantibacterium flavum TaxID=1382802 RepID=A0ABW4S0C2_9RHOB
MTNPNPATDARADDLNDAGLRDRAVAAACARAPFDILLTGGIVADMATGETRAADVGIVGPLIASVHAPGTRDDAARMIDLAGAVVAPGLIDMHMHIESSMMTPRRYAEVVVPQGTTTVCWDPHEVGNVAGLDGVRWAIGAARGLDLRVLALAPSCVPSAPGLERAGADLGADAMAEMLSWPDIHGVAEVMDMRGVLDRSPRMRGIIDAGLTSGKLVCGHARGLSGADLQGFAAAGIGSDHEITSGADIVEKLRAGFTVELRGSHDYVLPGVVAELMALPRVPQTLTLCTDDVFPDDLVEKGGMIDLIRRLIGYGLPAMEALRAATLNAAMRLGRADLGLVAPGRRADLVVLDDLAALKVRRVFASGREVARDGVALTAAASEISAGFRGTVRVPPMRPDDFILRIDAPDGTEVEVQTIFRPRFTEWRSRVLTVRDGRLDLPPDVLMMAVVHRHGLAAPTPVLGLLEDWGSWTGALATTVAHDSHNLTVFGRAPSDMAAAANALIGCDGGMAVARDGEVTALLPLPVAGLLSDAAPKEIARAFRTLRDAADTVADWAPPLRSFKAVVGASLACNPGPHVTDMGLACGTTGEFRPLLR